MKKRKSGLAVVKYIVVVVVLINVLASVLPLFLDTAGDLFGDSDNERYSDLRIIDVQGQMVPDYKGRTAGDGYQMYRFDLTVNNQGSHVEQLAYISFYLSGNDGKSICSMMIRIPRRRPTWRTRGFFLWEEMQR